MPMCMRMEKLVKKLSTIEDPWSFQHLDFLDNHTGSLKDKWNNLIDCMTVKGFHLFGLCRFRWKDI
jgi:hypothetical protein